MAIMTIEPAQSNVLERVIIEGDLSRLNPQERVNYYAKVCQTIGVNPYTRPFDYIVLNGKLTLYALKNATDQLRKIHGISITQLDVKDGGDYYSVVAYGKDKEGRLDSALASVWVKNLSGDARCNAMMKCETKSKRRLTLSMCGLGFLDETEVETIPEARTVSVDMETGEVLEQTKRELPKPANPGIVDDPEHRLWQRYVEVADQAEQVGIPFERLTLPIGRNLLVAEGQKLTRVLAEVSTPT